MGKIRLGIDARLYGPRHRGLGRYTEWLIKTLLNKRDEIEIVAFARGEDGVSELLHQIGCEVVEVNFSTYGWREQFLFSGVIRKAGVDLMHFPHINVPIFYAGPYVVTVHDLILHHFPGRLASTRLAVVYWFKYAMYRFVSRRAIKAAKAVIAVSYFTAEDVLTYYPSVKDKLYVIKQGVVDLAEDLPQKADMNAQLSYNIQGPFAMAVGAFYPHKNIRALIKAWPKVYSKIGLRLLLVGRIDSFAGELRREAEQLGLLVDKDAPVIQFTGEISDHELARFYQKTSFTIFPSCYEGYGLPGLEALGVGGRVVSGACSVLPETYGRAVTYVPTKSSKALAEALIQVVRGGLYQNKSTYRVSSPRDTAVSLVKVYKKI